MQGAARAAENRRDELTAQAYTGVFFYGKAQAGKLKSLDRYLIHPPKPKPQSSEELIARFKALAACGKLEIKKIGGKDGE